MSKHMSEPWKAIIHRNEQYPYPLSIVAEDDTEWIVRDGTVSSLAYRDRIIACVNACAGINPDAVPDLLDVLKTIENDESQVPEWLWDRIQVAIAKAKAK